jgi:hypothetical protein
MRLNIVLRMAQIWANLSQNRARKFPLSFKGKGYPVRESPWHEKLELNFLLLNFAPEADTGNPAFETPCSKSLLQNLLFKNPTSKTPSVKTRRGLRNDEMQTLICAGREPGIRKAWEAEQES